MTVTADDLVRREVHYCVSALVSTLANRPDDGPRLRSAAGNDLADLCWQAIELAMPIDDWEEAAFQKGWTGKPGAFRRNGLEGVYVAESWQELCELEEIEPYQREVFEHWIVSDWLAEKLAAKGEKVDTDFAGLTVWARTTTGQGIASDSVIQDIVADLNKPESSE